MIRLSHWRHGKYFKIHCLRFLRWRWSIMPFVLHCGDICAQRVLIWSSCCRQARHGLKKDTRSHSHQRFVQKLCRLQRTSHQQKCAKTRRSLLRHGLKRETRGVIQTYGSFRCFGACQDMVSRETRKLLRSESYSGAWPPADSMVSRGRQEGGLGPTIRTEKVAASCDRVEHNRASSFKIGALRAGEH